MMARIREIERRLLNWAREKVLEDSGGSGRCSGMRWGEEATQSVRDRYAYADAPIPVNSIEAAETDKAVRTLAIELQRTLDMHYVQGQLKESEKLRRLGGIARSTFHGRIDTAHRLLATYFTDRQQRARQERERVERLQRAGVA